ncbi:MAG: hypothetical protein ABIN18_05600 [Pseudomonadota bacterium]
MGGSKSKDVKTTNITTTTETTMRDVGLTGQNAVDMAAVLSTGAIESTRISAASLDNLIQTVGKSSQQLIGGASDLVRTQGEIAAQGGSDLMKIAPYLAIAAVVALPLMLKRGKR